MTCVGSCVAYPTFQSSTMASKLPDGDRIAETTAGQLRIALRQCREQLARLEATIRESRQDNQSPPKPEVRQK